MIKLTQGTDIDWHYINTAEQIPELIEIIKDKDTLILDTETYALKKYGDRASALDPHTSRISLIQLNFENNYNPYIIDVIKIGVEDVLPLIEFIAQEHILKLFHNATFDLKQIKSTFGLWLENVHCTKVLMQTLGISVGFKGSQMRGHSLLSLARDYFDVHLDKTESKSDWSQRPLTKIQQEYAALDTGSTKESGIDSIVLQGYYIIKNVLCNTFNEEEVMTIDQEAMLVTARVEYAGLYVDKDMLQIIYTKSSNEMISSRFKLCEALNLPLQQEVILEDGEFKHVTIVPDKVATLLNNNKGLVHVINQMLLKTTGKKLSSLQAGELEKVLKEIEQEKDEEDEENVIVDKEDKDEFNNYGSELIKDLLNYKTYNKLLSESEKYLRIINPVTGRVHAGLNAIGAATSRMSSSGDLNLQQVSSLSMKLDIPEKLLE